jgi:hypothetical protein
MEAALELIRANHMAALDRLIAAGRVQAGPA